MSPPSPSRRRARSGDDDGSTWSQSSFGVRPSSVFSQADSSLGHPSSRAGSRGQPSSRAGSRGQPSSRRAVSPLEGGSRPGTQLSSFVGRQSGAGRPVTQGSNLGASQTGFRKRGPVQFAQEVCPDAKEDVEDVSSSSAPESDDDSASATTDVDERQHSGAKEVDGDEILRQRYRRQKSSVDGRQRFMSVIEDQRRYLDDMYNGYFTDYLVRRRSDKTQALASKRMLDPALKGEEASDAYRDGAAFVHIEKLLSSLKTTITKCYKSQGAPGWTCTGKEWLTHSKQLIAKTHAACSLRVKVDNWLLMQNLRVRPNLRRGEEEWENERRDRLKQFYSTYHGSHKRVLVKSKDTQTFLGEARQMSSSKNGKVSDAEKKSPKTKQLSYSSKGGKAPGCRSEDAWKMRKSMGRTGGFGRALDGSAEKDTPAFPSLAATSDKAGFLAASMTKLGFASGTGLRFRASESGAGGRGLEKTRSQRIGKSASAPLLPSLTEKPQAPLLPSLTEKPQATLPHSQRDSVSRMHKTSRYTRACDHRYVLPNLIPFCTGHSSKLQAVNQGMGDQDLLAVTAMMESVDDIKEVDLEGNSLLTERSLVPFLETLRWPKGQDLTNINLKGCMFNITTNRVHVVVSEIISLMQRESIHMLVRLDLSGIRMGIKTHLPLCQAVSEHPRLTHLALADVQLNYQHPHVKTCLDQLCRSSVENLDIGWNAFDDDVFQHLGREVSKCASLKSLGLASCASTSAYGSSSIDLFLECLEGGSEHSIKHLDVSQNLIDFRGALVLEAALMNCRSITSLKLSWNPLFMLGIRAVLRLMSRDTSGLLSFECEGCCSNGDAPTGDILNYSEANPGGRYQLQLHKPYDRALLRMLYWNCDRYDLRPEEAFKNLTSDCGFTHPARSADGRRHVPSQGCLDVTFSVECLLPKLASHLQDSSYDFMKVLDAVFHCIRIKPAARKQVPFFAQWARLAGQDLEQLSFLQAMSKDFQVTLPEFDYMCRTRGLIPEIAARLLSSIEGYRTADGVREYGGTYYLCLLKMPTMGEYLKFMKRGKAFFNLNTNNPTGRYLLNLQNCCDYSVAEQLQLLDHWENLLGERRGLVVVAQRGIRSHVRNEVYQDKKLADLGVRSFSDFLLPENGELKFDYASSKRPPKGAKALLGEAFQDILFTIQKSSCPILDRIKAVKFTSNLWFLDSLQMRAFMGIFEESAVRAEIFVSLSTMLVDMGNEKIFRARFEDAKEYWNLLDRLGHVTCFPFIQPEQTDFTFDLSKHDQRLAMHCMMTLAVAEGIRNITEFSYQLPDGTFDFLPLGVPISWANLEKLPTAGTFKCHYICSPDTRNFKVRQTLMEQYGFREPPASADKVTWWSSISNCPEDVVEFVEFINTNFNNVWEVFRVIDGDTGCGNSNGELSYVEFEEGMRELNCKKFKTGDESKRIKAVFRYIDSSGEGSVSMGEWGVLDQIFKEIQLSIMEFVEFCDRTFADLEEAWKTLDEDGSGDIDMDEWCEGLKRLGYFGLARPIFSYIDMDDEGTVSWDEFMLLETYQEKLADRDEQLRHE